MNKILIAGVIVVAIVFIFLGLRSGDGNNEDDPIRDATVTETTTTAQ